MTHEQERMIEHAARTLVALVLTAERGERSGGAELELEVEITGGGVEAWKISIERISSSH